MQENEIVLTNVKGKREYKLSLSKESPLGETLDVINEYRQFIIQKINESVQEAPQTEPEKD